MAALLSEGKSKGGDIVARVIINRSDHNTVILSIVWPSLAVFAQRTKHLPFDPRHTPSTYPTPPGYSDFSGVNSMLASLTITWSPCFPNYFRKLRFLGSMRGLKGSSTSGRMSFHFLWPIQISVPWNPRRPRRQLAAGLLFQGHPRIWVAYYNRHVVRNKSLGLQVLRWYPKAGSRHLSVWR